MFGISLSEITLIHTKLLSYDFGLHNSSSLHSSSSSSSSFPFFLVNERWSKHMIRLWSLAYWQHLQMHSNGFRAISMANPSDENDIWCRRSCELFAFCCCCWSQSKQTRTHSIRRMGSVQWSSFLEGNITRTVENVLKNQIATMPIHSTRDRSIPINLENQKSKNCNRFFSQSFS